MTPDEFRKVALRIPGAIEAAHMSHPDFRIGGKIFASLGAPDASWGMVKLTPEEQRIFVGKAPSVFKPCNGAWGRQGCTYVRLASADKVMLRSAIEAAAMNTLSRANRKRA